MIRKGLSECTEPHGPLPWFSQCIFKFASYIHFSDLSAPSLAAGSTLVAKSTDIISFIAKQISKSGHIYSVWTATIIVFIIVSFGNAGCSATEVMIHYVMSQFSAAAAQSVRPY